MLYMKSTTKRKAHYDLKRVKELIAAGSFSVSMTAANTATDLGVESKEAVGAFMLTLSNKDFYKSITSDFDHKEWQDVYHPMVGAVKGYVKFKVNKEVVVLSFKEKTEW